MHARCSERARPCRFEYDLTERLEYFTSQPRVNFATGIITRVIYDASDAGIPAVEKDGAKG